MSVLDRFLLTGKTALITGGSRGLGRAMAQAFAEAGADLILVGREAESLATARKELIRIGRRVETLVGDAGTTDGAAAVCDAAIGLGHDIDILVNNVGGRRSTSPTEDMPIDEWRKLFDLNLTSAWCAARRSVSRCSRGGAAPSSTSRASRPRSRSRASAAGTTRRRRPR